MYKSSRPEVFYKKGVLENFTKFTEKHFCWGLFLVKLQDLRPKTLLRSDFTTGVSCKFYKIF